MRTGLVVALWKLMRVSLRETMLLHRTWRIRELLSLPEKKVSSSSAPRSLKAFLRGSKLKGLGLASSVSSVLLTSMLAMRANACREELLRGVPIEKGVSERERSERRRERAGWQAEFEAWRGRAWVARSSARCAAPGVGKSERSQASCWVGVRLALGCSIGCSRAREYFALFESSRVSACAELVWDCPVVGAPLRLTAMSKKRKASSPVEGMRQQSVASMFQKKSDAKSTALSETAQRANVEFESCSVELENFWDSNLRTILTAKTESYDSQFLDECGNIARMRMVPNQAIFETIIRICKRENVSKDLSLKAFNLLQTLHTLFPPVVTKMHEEKPVIYVDRAAWTPVDSHLRSQYGDDEDDKEIAKERGMAADWKTMQQMAAAVISALEAAAEDRPSAVGKSLGKLLMFRHTVNVLQDDLAQRMEVFKAHRVGAVVENSLLYRLTADLKPAGPDSLEAFVEKLVILVGVDVEEDEDDFPAFGHEADHAGTWAVELEAARRAGAVLLNLLLELYYVVQHDLTADAGLKGTRSDAKSSMWRTLTKRLGELYTHCSKQILQAEKKLSRNDDLCYSQAALLAAVMLPRHKMQVIGMAISQEMSSKKRAMPPALQTFVEHGGLGAFSALDVLSLVVEVGPSVRDLWGTMDAVVALCCHAVLADVDNILAAGGGGARAKLTALQEKLGDFKQMVKAADNHGRRLSVSSRGEGDSYSEAGAMLAAGHAQIAAALKGLD
mmetsp:Transcript_64664/g.204132  ORF Transcript_64664/g.204132 Transcript_64664/m.204132 type:complete len:731 (+) Transcript_64664:782-2974(+)